MNAAIEPRDLTREGTPGLPTAADSTRELVAEKPYDPVRERENIRGKIATRLVGTLVLVIGMVVAIGVVTAMLCGYSGKCVATTVELRAARAIVELVLTPLVGLVGAVTGFYYGEKSGSSGRADPAS